MSLAKSMARQAGHHEVWIALNDKFPDTIPDIRWEFDGLVPKEHIVTFSVPGQVLEENSKNLGRTRAAELLREYFLAGLNPDIVHVTSMFEGYKQDVVSSVGAFNTGISNYMTLFHTWIRKHTFQMRK
jgi:hypothetical protein